MKSNVIFVSFQCNLNSTVFVNSVVEYCEKWFLELKYYPISFCLVNEEDADGSHWV